MNYIDQFEDTEDKMSFFDHLDAFRGHLIRISIAILVFAILAFAYKSFVFDSIILAPIQVDFSTYQFFCSLSQKFNFLSGLCITHIPYEFINVTMIGQFVTHVTVSFVFGIIFAFPYLIFELWRFVKPALNPNEKKYARGLLFYVSILFFIGILFGYFLLAPISTYFLGTYQVSELISNKITLTSYISLLTTLTLGSGLIFELPILAYFLAKIGIISSPFLKKYRKQAFLINLVLAAIITPSDVMSMFLMALPLSLLYELSIRVVARVEKKKLAEEKSI